MNIEHNHIAGNPMGGIPINLLQGLIILGLIETQLGHYCPQTFEVVKGSKEIIW